jgi:hypothetical protein
MFQFMFMVQLLVKFRFFIQELWERKSLQILYECWRRAHEISPKCIQTIRLSIPITMRSLKWIDKGVGAAVYLFYWWWKLCFIISQNSQVKIFYVKFKPNFTGRYQTKALREISTCMVTQFGHLKKLKYSIMVGGNSCARFCF